MLALLFHSLSLIAIFTITYLPQALAQPDPCGVKVVIHPSKVKQEADPPYNWVAVYGYIESEGAGGGSCLTSYGAVLYAKIYAHTKLSDGSTANIWNYFGPNIHQQTRIREYSTIISVDPSGIWLTRELPELYSSSFSGYVVPRQGETEVWAEVSIGYLIPHYGGLNHESFAITYKSNILGLDQSTNTSANTNQDFNSSEKTSDPMSNNERPEETNHQAPAVPEQPSLQQPLETESDVQVNNNEQPALDITEAASIETTKEEEAIYSDYVAQVDSHGEISSVQLFNDELTATLDSSAGYEDSATNDIFFYEQSTFNEEPIFYEEPTSYPDFI